MAYPLAMIFDIDRTLVDVRSHVDLRPALEEVRRLAGVSGKPRTPDTGWDEATRACMDTLVALGGDRRWQAVSDAIAAYEEEAAEASTPMPGVEEAMRRCGGLRLIVVTLLPDRVARAVLARHRIPIGLVVGRRQGLASKPAPDQVLLALERLGVGAGAARMIGDSTWDAAAAGGAGVPFVGVTNGSASEFPQGVPVAETIDQAVELALG